jgi:hypothetical protein
MVRKFYDAGPDAGGGSPTETKVDFSSFVSVSNETQADSDAETADEGGSGDSGDSGEGQSGGEATASTEKKVEVTPGTGAGQSAAEIKAGDEGNVAGDWFEAIKGVDKKDVLSKLGSKSEVMKALGLSEFVINLNDYYERTGDAEAYLRANAIDYAKMPDDEAILEGIRREKPGAPESVVQRLYQKEMEKYETDPDVYDAETVQYGNYLKKEKADEYRSKFIEDQKKFSFPAKEAPSNDTDAANAQAAEQAKIEAINKGIVENDATKKILSDKLLRIGGKDGYNFDAGDPQELVDMAVGKKNFFDMFSKEDGSVDLDLFYAVAAFAKNRANYEKSLIDHGRSLANKEHTEDDNAIQRDRAGAAKELSAWQNLERNGIAVKN